MNKRDTVTEWQSNGREVVFRSGCRVTWTNNILGLGGATLSGVFVDAVDIGHGEYAACIDAEPSDSLRKLADQYRGSTVPNKWPIKIHGADWPDDYAGKGLDGNGGKLVISREELSRAVYDGYLTLTPLPDGAQDSRITIEITGYVDTFHENGANGAYSVDLQFGMYQGDKIVMLQVTDKDRAFLDANIGKNVKIRIEVTAFPDNTQSERG
jgi:hypothetical protein